MKISKYLTRESLLNVTHAFISSRLDCNNSLLYGLPAEDIRRVQMIQNTAARIITRAKKDEHITPYLLDLHWLPVKFRIMFKILTITFKCLHQNDSPVYLSEMLSIKEVDIEADGVLTCSSEAPLFNIPKSGTKHYKERAFSTAGPVLWNDLPKDIRLINSFDLFKSALKTHFFKIFMSEL